MRNDTQAEGQNNANGASGKQAKTQEEASQNIIEHRHGFPLMRDGLALFTLIDGLRPMGAAAALAWPIVKHRGRFAAMQKKLMETEDYSPQRGANLAFVIVAACETVKRLTLRAISDAACPEHGFCIPVPGLAGLRAWDWEELAGEFAVELENHKEAIRAQIIPWLSGGDAAEMHELLTLAERLMPVCGFASDMDRHTGELDDPTPQQRDAWRVMAAQLAFTAAA